MTDIKFEDLKSGDRLLLELKGKQAPIRMFATFLAPNEKYVLLDEHPTGNAQGYSPFTSIFSLHGSYAASANRIIKAGFKEPEKAYYWHLDWETVIKRVLPKDGEIRASDLVRGDRIEITHDDKPIKATVLGNDWIWLDTPITTGSCLSITPKERFDQALVKNTILTDEPRLWHLTIPREVKISKLLSEKSNLVDKPLVPAASEDVVALQVEVGGLKSELSEIKSMLSKLVSKQAEAPKTDTIAKPPTPVKFTELKVGDRVRVSHRLGNDFTAPFCTYYGHCANHTDATVVMADSERVWLAWKAGESRPPICTKSYAEFAVSERLASKPEDLAKYEVVHSFSSSDYEGVMLPPEPIDAHKIVSCNTCKDTKKVLGDCSDSPNMWMEACPDCATAKEEPETAPIAANEEPAEKKSNPALAMAGMVLGTMAGAAVSAMVGRAPSVRVPDTEIETVLDQVAETLSTEGVAS